MLIIIRSFKLKSKIYNYRNLLKILYLAPFSLFLPCFAELYSVLYFRLLLNLKKCVNNKEIQIFT